MSASQTRRTSRSASQSRSVRSERMAGSYMYGSAAPAYESESAFEVVRNPKPRQGVSVLPSDIIGVAKLIIVVIAVVAAIACVRVAFTAASVSMCMESETISAQIETARSQGSDLEVQRSYLSNTSHVRVAATQLGMGAPVASSTITLDPDVVALDAAGNLSLSGSMAAIAAQG
mgnify:FL=1